MSEAEQIEKAFSEWERLTAGGDPDADWERQAFKAGIEFARAALAAQAARAEQLEAERDELRLAVTYSQSELGRLRAYSENFQELLGLLDQHLKSALATAEPRAGQPPQTVNPDSCKSFEPIDEGPHREMCVVCGVHKSEHTDQPAPPTARADAAGGV